MPSFPIIIQILIIQNDKHNMKNPRNNPHPQPEHQQLTSSLAGLQKKYEEEKQILVRENKRIQKQLYDEIEENNANRLKFQKKQQQLKNSIDSLVVENSRLKSEMLLGNRNDQYQQHDENKVIDEEDYAELMYLYKTTSKEKQELSEKIENYIEGLAELAAQNKRLDQENQQYQTTIKMDEIHVENCKNEVENIRNQYEILQKGSRELSEELEMHIRVNEQKIQKLTHKNNTLKQKNMNYEHSIIQLEDKLTEYEKKQNAQYQQSLQAWKQKEETLSQQLIIRDRKISFLEIQLNQKKQYIENLANELQNIKQTNQQRQNRIQELQPFENALHKTENQNRRLIIELENLRDRIGQSEQKEKKYTEDIAKIKQKIAQQVYELCQAGGGRDAIMQKYMQGLRTTKSEAVFGRGNLGIQKQGMNNDFQKFKLQSQICNLNNQLEASKKQNQSFLWEINKIKKELENKKDQNSEQLKKIKELELVADKVEHQKISQEQKLRQQIRDLKNKETELLEFEKNYGEMQEALNLKLNFYERKVKELVETLQRKESMIQSLKNQRIELQSRSKFMEEKAIRYVDEIQSYKKFKNDTIRKEDLLKDYKQKVQKVKTQLEKSREDLEKAKKQKNRLERALENKQDLVSTLKDKANKDKIAADAQLKQETAALRRELKKDYEAKLKNFKTQIQERAEVIEKLRLVMVDKIEEIILQNQEKQNIKNQNHTNMLDPETNNEAAELLGLGAKDIEQFINPSYNIDRNICEDLDSLWDKGQYEEFMRNSLEYLLLKVQNPKQQNL